MPGKKTFVDGTTLTASDVNGYLMDQATMRFATTSARDTAIPTPTEGMNVYIDADDSIYIYNGSAWMKQSSIGAWTAYTPTWGNVSVGNGSVDATYTQIGKTVLVQAKLSFGSTTTNTSTVVMSIPVTARRGSMVTGVGTFYSAAGTNFPAFVRTEGTGEIGIYWSSAGGAWVTWAGGTGAGGMTNGAHIAVTLVYEAA